MTGVDATNPVNVLFGDVLSVNPLSVHVDQRFTLTREFLVLSEQVIPYSIDVSHRHTYDGGTTAGALGSLDLRHNHVEGARATTSALSSYDLEHHHELDGEDTSNALSSLDLEHEHTIEEGVTEDALTTPYNLQHSHTYDGGTTDSALSTIVIREGLKVGDKVILLRVQGGQKYVILDKVGIT